MNIENILKKMVHWIEDSKNYSYPPSKESIQILYGLKGKYQNYHKVRYTNSAIEACVKLSQKYITDKFLPDKAIDLLDEAGAKAHMFNFEVPKKILK